MTKQTNGRGWGLSLNMTAALALGSRSSLLCAVPLGLLVACGQTEKAGSEATTSDTTTSSTGPSGSTSSSGASSGASGTAASGTGTSSSVGSSGSSGGASTQTGVSNSTTSAGLGSTGSTSSNSASSESSTSSGTSGDSETVITSDGETAGPDAGGSDSDTGSGAEDDGSMTFFVSSTGVAEGGNLGGLEGADAFCTQLAAAVSESLGNKTWRAYLSTSTVNAKDRIGTGPWRNAEGVVVANNIDELHAQEAGEALDDTWPPTDLSIAVTENGDQVPNMIHDILTGSLPDGTVDADRHCSDWTSSESTDEASVGHSNRDGGGRPPYFNATHQVGCAQAPPTTRGHRNLRRRPGFDLLLRADCRIVSLDTQVMNGLSRDPVLSMQHGMSQQSVEPENTAARVALWRALHVQVDAPPHVFVDEVGLQLVAPEDNWQSRPDMSPFTRAFRASIVARARFIEDWVREQAAKGVEQYVILGAGLDTFAQRQTELASRLRVYEIDRAGPQAWKRKRLIELGFGLPDYLNFVAVDFESGEDWWERLVAAGFNPRLPSVVVSTGVSMYLSRQAIAATLSKVAAAAPARAW